MRKGIKYALVFTGGVAVGIGFCGANLICYALSDADIREGIKNKISRKIDKTLYGERPRRGTNPVSYRQLYEEKNKMDRKPFTYDELVFETRDNAEKVLSLMKNIIDEYGFVTVADMYDMADLPAPYTSNKYGWTSIQKAEVKRVRKGYIIHLPSPMSIE